jgi:hypothetical protein
MALLGFKLISPPIINFNSSLSYRFIYSWIWKDKLMFKIQTYLKQQNSTSV